jgi:hypothetical protein
MWIRSGGFRRFEANAVWFLAAVLIAGIAFECMKWLID